MIKKNGNDDFFENNMHAGGNKSLTITNSFIRRTNTIQVQKLRLEER
jgi:hypothetical protein